MFLVIPLTSCKEEDITNKRVLDVGCGYGFIGTVISVVTDSYVDMVDVNKRAVHLTKRNIKKQGKFKGNVFLSDAYSEVKDKYDVVITNPPIRVGKEKLLSILTGAFEHLNEDGTLYGVEINYSTKVQYLSKINKGLSAFIY